MALPIEGTNLKPGEQDAIGQLVLSAYQSERREGVLLASQTKAALDATGSPSEAARRLGASEYLHLSAVRLAERIVITATLYDREGQLMHSAKMTASSLDDVEHTAERLAKALVRRTTTKKTRELETVTKTEGKRPNRTWVEQVTGFKSAFTYPLGYGSPIAPMLSIGFNGRFESTHSFLEFGAGITIPPGDDSYDRAYGGVYGELGANWYLGSASSSPYVGAGVVPRLASSTITNLAPYAQAGMMFFRESSSRLYADVRIAQNVLPVGFSKTPPYDAETGVYPAEEHEKLYPTEFSFSLGVGF
jgi:hypothetical protein